MLRSHTEYILGTDRRLFQNVSVRYPRYSTDHYMVLGCLHISTLRDQQRYLGRRTRLFIHPPMVPMRTDLLFADLSQIISKPQRTERRRGPCISEETCIPMDAGFTLRRDPIHNQSRTRTLVLRTKVLLKRDKQQRAAEAGAEVKSLLAYNPPLIKEA